LPKLGRRHTKSDARKFSEWDDVCGTNVSRSTPRACSAQHYESQVQGVWLSHHASGSQVSLEVGVVRRAEHTSAKIAGAGEEGDVKMDGDVGIDSCEETSRQRSVGKIDAMQQRQERDFAGAYETAGALIR
jgi:hypothetical protein